ncbi:MAG: tyrosine-protein phosphatase [Alistipes sp.]|nr:tyrosine-protein phosphatase [Candidatus Alistipes equi]
MKNARFIVFLLLGIAFFSCQKSETGRKFTASFTAVLEQPKFNSRTQINDRLLSWSENDMVSLLSVGQNAKMTLSEGAHSRTATFSGEIEPAVEYYAVYPYSDKASLMDEPGKVSIFLPRTQYYTNNSISSGSNPMVAHLTNLNECVEFYNTCGLVTLRLSGFGTVNQVLLRSDTHEKLWGNFSVDMDVEPTSITQRMTYLSNGGETIVLECPEGVELQEEPTNFTFVVPAQSVSKNFTASVYFSVKEQIDFPVHAILVKRAEVSTSSVQTLAAPTMHAQVNPAVQKYFDFIHRNPYRDGDYSYTFIDKFCPPNESYRTDRPFPASIRWTKSIASQVDHIVVSTSSDYSSPFISQKIEEPEKCRTDISNTIPGIKYYYKIVSSTQKALIESAFMTYGERRFLNVDGIYNVRDLGGIPTSDGKKRIRYGKLYRGGRMNSKDINITKKGIETLLSIGIGADLDLRKDDEAQNITQSPLGPTVEYIRFPKSSSGYYQKLNDIDVNIREMQYVIDKLREEKPVYFHCAVGADRTGTLAFLIEGLLGVSENEMSIDYEVTSFSTPPGTRRRTAVPYDYSGMYDAISSVQGATLQEKFRNYFLLGINSTSISKEDLDWFENYMLEEIK